MAALLVPLVVTVASFVDPVIAAHVVVGEVGGASIWGSEQRVLDVQYLVAWVVRNRAWEHVRDGDVWLPGRMYDPRKDFYGWSDPVSTEEFRNVVTALEASEDEDPTEGCVHVLSQQDVEKLGVADGDIVVRGKRPFALHFYRAWPGDI